MNEQNNLKNQILLVEDEKKLGQSVQNELAEQGFAIDWAEDGKIGKQFFEQKKYDLIILDLNLPFISGMELCKMIRKQNTHIPIIMLTALGDLTNKLEAFTLGADDYIVKPFHLSELSARIHVFLKRRQTSTPPNSITIANLTIDFVAKSIVRAGKNIALTAKEFSLLSLLAQEKGRILSKQEIAEKVWETDFDTVTNTIEVYINFLRNKIDKNFEPKLIHTKLGFGYYLKVLEN